VIVARSSDLLRRFRLIAVPGKAGIAGVPADRETLLREELALVLAALRDVDHDATETIARATSEGEARRNRATLDAQRILGEAHEALPAARSAAATAETSAAESEAASIRATGHDEAERIRRDAAGRMAKVVDEIVRRVMSTGAPSEASP
jgi:vacuolar-type H+-ATPase subunit H